MLDVTLLWVLCQLGHLSLPLLCQLHLGLSEPLPQLFISGQVRNLPLGLGPRLSFGFQFILHLLNPALVLLDGLLHLAQQGLLIVQLGDEADDLGFLPHDAGNYGTPAKL